MNGHTIGTIYAKELRDSLRDRRTLISMIVLPTIIMPLLMFGLGTAASRIVSRARSEVPSIMVIGGDDSPGVRNELQQSGKFKIEPLTPAWKELISDKKVKAAVEIPPGFEKALALGSAPTVTIYDYQGELKSGIAADQLTTFFTTLRSHATAKLLTDHGLPVKFARPFDVARKNVAPPEKVGGNLLGGLVPYFIVILSLVGASYPAIDLTAGEKERGTMETLLCSPARRSDIVLGKFLMVLTGSLSAVFFSLVSLACTAVAVGNAASHVAGDGPAGITMPTIDPLGLVGVLTMILPVAVLFSALVFSIGLFAKSAKEAQSYLTPLMLVVIMPCAVAVLPGFELSFGMAFVPIANVSLVCKEMLSGIWHWDYISVIFGSTAIYAVAALGLAVRMFSREDVLFRT
jgi:sodium transport system permease protein